jgi:hypothetical protein
MLSSCGINKSSFSSEKKYSPGQLQKDYKIYQTILEEHHPGLYWYINKDSMDYFFNWGLQHLKDSMAEVDFRNLLTYVTAKINCGHTTVRSSKNWNRLNDTIRMNKMFPLSMKLWPDTMVITGTLLRNDSLLKRGTMVTKINGLSQQLIVDSMFNYISTDGFNRTHKFQTLSNRGSFGSLYTSLFGLSDKYNIEYKDENGEIKNTMITPYDPSTDTLFKKAIQISPVERRQRERQGINNIRLLKIDSVNHSAMMNLSSFARGYGLRKFFRNSFKALQEHKIEHLIIDVRGNGGGSVNSSTLITRYLVDKKFKISDSLFAISKGSAYQRYIKNHFWNKLFLSFFAKKESDGNFHFGYFERHYFKPKNNFHYNGKVYILTGGNSFSATTLFVNAIIKQDNVLVVGEETGGGAYGNTAWLIPDVTLPVTGIRFRLPLFRLVIDKNIPKDGKGVQPEVFSLPSIEAIKRGADYKLEKVMELIKKDKNE